MSEQVEKELPPARHEASDVGVRQALLGLVVTALVLVGIALVPRWLFPSARYPTPASAPNYFADPQLQPSPAADTQAFRAAEMRWLTSTGWVDQAHGIAHIPIDDAIRRVAETGIADWPTPAAGGAK
jgi:hypothetical protein